MNSNEEQKRGHHHHHDHGGRFGGGRKKFLFLVPLFAAMILAKAALVMVLWNYLIPDLFHGPALDYLQALGLMVLAKLFTGFHKPGGGMGGRFGHWRGRHWARLTPEERQKLRDHLHGKRDDAGL